MCTEYIFISVWHTKINKPQTVRNKRDDFFKIKKSFGFMIITLLFRSETNLKYLFHGEISCQQTARIIKTLKDWNPICKLVKKN